jgi:hypothetical protein
MDTVTLVATQIEDGQRLLDQLCDKGIAVRGACWVKPLEEDRWSLYIATPLVDEKGAAAAYRQVYAVLRSLEDVLISDSDIKLVGEKHPVAHDVLDFQRRYPGRTATLSQSPLFGGIPVEEVYVFPPGKVEVKIFGMVFRGEPSGGLHFSFEEHNPHAKLEVESMGTRKEYHAQTGIDWLVAAPEGAALERTTSGRTELAWTFRGNKRRSSANEVWTLANLGLHGFRFLREPK